MRHFLPLVLVMLVVNTHASIPAFLQYKGTQVAISVSGRGTLEGATWDTRAEIRREDRNWRFVGIYETRDTYNTYEVKYARYWHIIQTQAKALSYGGSDIYHLDLRYRYRGSNVGVVQQWEAGKPKSYLVAGTNYSKEINFFLTPARLQWESDMMTRDLKKYVWESNVRAELQIITLLSGELSVIMRDYGSIRWLIYTGLRLRW
jgi:hypothetical protein